MAPTIHKMHTQHKHHQKFLSQEKEKNTNMKHITLLIDQNNDKHYQYPTQ